MQFGLLKFFGATAAGTPLKTGTQKINFLNGSSLGASFFMSVDV